MIDKSTGTEVTRQPLTSTSSIQINGASDQDDTFSVDFSNPFWLEGGIEYHGGAGGFDILNFEGNGSVSISYTAIGTDSAAIQFQDGDQSMALAFTGLEPVTISSGGTLTFNTSTATFPGGAPASPGIDLITIDSPASGQNRISGTSGGESFESVTFFNIANVIIDTGSNDSISDRNDSVTISAAGLVAAGLQNLTVTTGDGDDELIVEATSLSLPVAGGSITYTAGSGDDSLVIHDGASADFNVDGGGGIDSIVNQAGTSGTVTATSVETLIDRPVLFIHGFAGSLTDDLTPAGFDNFLLNRGLSPDLLALEPLSNGYSDIMQSLENIGYVNGTNAPGVLGTAFAALWDWRVTVADTNDTDGDGILSDVTAASIQDAFDSAGVSLGNVFESALDYLGYWLKQATSAWKILTGSKPSEVDMITHSTGGLVSKAYIQSAAYGANADTPTINTLIQSGVPNKGTGATYGLLKDNYNLKAETRVAALFVDAAYDRIDGGGTLNNPDGTTLLQAGLPANKADFNGLYVETLTDLLATFAFLDLTEDNVENPLVLTPANGGSALLAELNAVGADAFVSGVTNTVIHFSQEKSTPDLVSLHTGLDPSAGLKNLILPFENVLGRLPGENEVWYETSTITGLDAGDSTVSAFSATDEFDSGVLLEITQANAGATDPIGHVGLVQNPYSQTKVLEALTGNLYSESVMSSDKALSKADSALNLLALGLIDPVEFASAAFAELSGLVGDIEGQVSTFLNQKIPIINKSPNELFDEPATPLFDVFGSVANALHVASNETSLPNLEEFLEDQMGISDTPNADSSQFEIDLTGAALTLGFAFGLSESTSINVDLGTSGVPITGTLPMTLGVSFDLDVDLTIDFAEMFGASSGSSANGVILTLNNFQAQAALTAPDLDLAIGFGPFGSLTVENGSGNITGTFGVDLNDPNNEVSLEQLKTEDFASLATVASSGSVSLNLPITAGLGGGLFSISGSGTLAINDSDVFDGNLPEVTFNLVNGSIVVADLLTLSGDVSFRSVGADIEAVGSSVTARMDAGGSFVELAGAEFGLIAGDDGTFAFELKNGALTIDLSPLTNVTSTGVSVQYTNATTTVAANTEIVAGGLTYTFVDGIAANVAAFTVEGLQADVLGFVSLSGDFGFRQEGAGILAVGSAVTVRLEVSPSVYAELAGAEFGLIADAGSFAFELKNGNPEISLGSIDKDDIDADAVRFQFTNAVTTVSANTTIGVGALSYTFVNEIAPNTVGVVLEGFDAHVRVLGTEIFRLSGDFALKKTGLELVAVGNNLDVRMEVASDIYVELVGADFGLIAGAGTFAFELKNGNPEISLGPIDKDDIDADAVRFQFTNAVTTVSANTMIGIGTVNYTFVDEIAPNTIGVAVEGFDAHVRVLGTEIFRLSGDFALKKTGLELVGVGSDMDVRMEVAPDIYVELVSADFGLIAGGGQFAFELKNGNPEISLGPIDKDDIDADTLFFQFTNPVTTVSANTTIGVGTVNYTFVDEIAPNTVGVAVEGFDAHVRVAGTEIFHLTGDLGFKKSLTEIIAVGNGVTVRLEVDPAVYVELAQADFGLIAGPGKFVFELKNGVLDIALGPIANVTADEVFVQFSNPSPTSTVSAGDEISVGPVIYTFDNAIAANTVAFAVVGLSADVGGVFKLSGNVGFKRSGLLPEILAVGNDVTVRMEVDPAVYVELADADFGLVSGIGKFVFELKNGALTLALGPIANVTADAVFVQFSGPTTTVTAGTSISVGGLSYTFEQAITVNTVAVALEGFDFDVGGVFHLSGDLGFKKSGVVPEIVAVGNDVTVRMEATSSVYAELAQADFGLVAGSGRFAFELSNGSLDLQLGSIANITATEVFVQFSNPSPTSAVSAGTTISVGPVSYTFDSAIAANTVAFAVVGLSADIGGVFSVSGDIGFKKSGLLPEIVGVGNNVAVRLEATSSVYSELANADFGLIAGAGKFAFEMSNGSLGLQLGPIANITATEVFVQFSGPTTTVANGTTISVGPVSYTFDNTIAVNTVAFAVVGLSADIGGIFKLSGDIGFKKSGVVPEILAVGNNVTVRLEATSSVYVELANADFGLIAGSGKFVFELKNGSLEIELGGFSNITAVSVFVQFSNPEPTSTVSAGTTISVGGINHTFTNAIAANTVAFTVNGLDADVAGVFKLSGDLGFKKSGVSPEIVAVGNNVTVRMEATSSVYVELANADFGLIAGSGKFVFELKNGVLDVQLAPLANVTAASVFVQFSNPAPTSTVTAGTTISVGGISYTFNSAIAPNTVAFAVQGLNASVGGVLTVTGDMGFSKSLTLIKVVANNVTARLAAAPTVFVEMRNASFGLIAGLDNGSAKFAFELKDGTIEVDLGPVGQFVVRQAYVQVTGPTTTITAGDTISVGPVTYVFGSNIAPATISFFIDGILLFGPDVNNGFMFDGTFTFTANPAGLQLATNVTLKAAVGGNTLFNVAADGALLLNSEGIASRISVDLGSGFSGTGFNFSGTFFFELNSTGSAIGTIAGQAVNLEPGPYVRLRINGNLELLGGAFTLSGTFDLAINSGQATVAMNASVSVFGQTLSVDGLAGLYYDSNPGIAFSIRLKLGTDDTPTVVVVPGLFTITGALQLEVNTTGVSRSGIGSGLKIAATNLSVNLSGFVLTGSLIIDISPGGLSITIPTSNPLTLDFFGFIDLSVSGNLNTAGSFSFSASASVSILNPDVFGFSGTISVGFSNSGFSGGLSGSFGAFGIKISAGGSFFIESGLVKIDVYLSLQITPEISFKFWRPFKTIRITIPAIVISGHWTFTFGGLTTAPAPPPTPILATVLGNTLRLNIGTDAVHRGDSFAAQDESYTITVIGAGSSGVGQRLKVSGLGFDQEYDNITHIVANNTLGTNNYIATDTSVAATVSINSGQTVSGQNRYQLGGSGAAFVQGGSSQDTVEFSGASSTYVGGPGQSQIKDNSGGTLAVRAPGFASYLLADESLSYDNGGVTYVMSFVGNSVKNVILDGAANATYQTSSIPDPSDGIATPWTGNGTFNGTGPSSLVQASAAGGITLTDTSVTLSGTTIALNSIATANLIGGDGNNTFTVSGWTHSGNITGNGGSDTVVATNDRNFTVSDSSLDRSGLPSVSLSSIEVANLSGGGSSNTFSVSNWTGSGALNGNGGTDTVIASNDRSFTLSDSSLGRSGLSSLSLSSVEVANLTGGGSANTFTVSSWTGAANLNGVGGSDTYTVNVVGSGSGSVTINDTGASAGDTLTVNGTGAANPFTISSTQVMVASETINYANLEALTVNGHGGNDSFVVVNTSIPTTINGGDNDDSITVNGNSAALTLNGDTGLDTMFVNGSNAALTLNGGANDDTFNLRAFSADAILDTGSGVNTVNVGSAELAAAGNVNAINGKLTIVGGGSDTLNVNDTGDGSANTGLLTALRLTGLGMAGNNASKGIDYASVESLLIALGAGGNTFNIQSTAGNTTTRLRTGSGSSTVNVGSAAGTGSSGNANGISGRLIVEGQGASDILNVDDTTDGASNTGLLTSTRLTGLGMGDSSKGIEYSSVEALNIGLGGGSDTFNIQSTASVSLTTLNTGGGANAVNVGSSAPGTGGTVNSVSGKLIVNGEGSSDTLNVDDTGDGASNTGLLTSTRLTGLDMGDSSKGIQYAGIESLNVSLGSGSDDFSIQTTHAALTVLNTFSGADRVAINSTSGATTVNTGNGADTVNAGSLASVTANSGGTLNLIAGALTINGDGVSGEDDTLNLDDTGDTNPNTGLLTGTTVTGLDLGPSGITYGGLETLNLNLGSASDVLNIRGTSAVTNILANNGNDRVYVSSLANESTAAAPTEFLRGDLNQILGTLNLDLGDGRHLLMISDESANVGDGTAGNPVRITDQPVAGLPPTEITITGLTPAPAITYKAAPAGNLADGVTIWTGWGAETIFVDGAHQRGNGAIGSLRTVTTLNTGLGDDSVTVDLNAADGFFVLNTQGPENAFVGLLSDRDNVDASTSTRPLVIFGGQDDDTIRGGKAADIIFGDRGLVTHFSGVTPVAVFGNGGPGDRTDGVERALGFVATTSPEVGGNDTVYGLEGRDFLFGGFGGDLLDASASDVADDILVGDNGEARFSNGIITQVNTTSTSLGGNDTVIAGKGANIAFGGVGNDTIVTGGDNLPDILVGDNGTANFDAANGRLLEIFTSAPADAGADVLTTGDGNSVVFGGSFSDLITSGAGSDIVVGDNGHALFHSSTYVLVSIASAVPEQGTGVGRLVEGVTYDDVINAGVGNNIVIGGSHSDYIFTLGGDDTVVGDNGNATFDATGILRVIQTDDPSHGDGDRILTGNGADIVLAGSGSDFVDAGSEALGDISRDIVAGDNGRAEFDAAGFLALIFATVPDTGGPDTILLGGGNNVALGGADKDTITGGSGNDIILGDNGSATFDPASHLLVDIHTTDPVDADWDLIDAGNGNNVVFGGTVNDTITTGSGGDVVVGDNGIATFYPTTGILKDIQTSDPTFTGDDLINSGIGPDVVIGGSGSDLIDSGSVAAGDVSRDVVVGDNGRAEFDTAGRLTFVTTLVPDTGGVDNILIGAGDNVAFGGAGSDTLTGGNGNDIVVGDNGFARFDPVTLSIARVETTDVAFGGIDTIVAGDGNNIILGGSAGDVITTGSGDDIALGDNGYVDFVVADGNPADIDVIASTEFSTGGADTITTGAAADIVIGGQANDGINAGTGNNIVFGGTGADTIVANDGETGASPDGDNLILGDDGTIDYVRAERDPGASGGDTNPADIDLIASSDFADGAADVITTGEGSDIIVGGQAGDTIVAGNGNNLVIGDSGLITAATEDGNRYAGQSMTLGRVETVAFGIGGVDTITTGAGNDFVLGGHEGDTIHAGNGNNIVLGDDGVVDYVRFERG
ncbi:MAG: hypothetical protein O2960_03590, partial [Verrucomicrobia bacterium]|nr:hypothetical protein [Verrucomicrobiota bacterium]